MNMTPVRKRFRLPILAFCVTAALGIPRIAGAQPKAPDAAMQALTAKAQSLTTGTLSPYVDPHQLTNVPFGTRSHWAQPWRAYLPTVPAATFLDGIGVNMGSGDPASVVPALAAQGVRHLRYEEPWMQVDFNDPTRLDNADGFSAFLLSCKATGVRPLILLNGNTGIPCPTRYSTATVAAQVSPGDSTITFTNASGIVVDHTGLTNVTGYAAARPLFTGVSGNTVKLSQPCPTSFFAGQQITLTTLKYVPFSTDGDPNYNDTVAGWQRYAQTVAASARAALGTVGKADGGFDMECWNELTFGSDFLSAGNYGCGNGQDMTQRLVQITADIAQSDPADFSGVGIGDGMANTFPFPYAADQPMGVAAIDKHPYAGRAFFPGGSGTNLNAQYQADGWQPSYTEHFPEYFGTMLQTESLLRDASPFNNPFSPTDIHGRYAQPGRDIPVWITEYRYDADAGGAADQVTKSILRFYCFYLNKGVTQADYFNSDALFAQPNALTALARICSVMRSGLDRKAPAGAVGLTSVSDTHGHLQFTGGGTAAHPALYDRDVFAFLPYQVSARRFVIPYYVMTRDAARDLPAENFTLKLSLLSRLATAQTYDPLTGKYGPATLLVGQTPTLTVAATDSPRLLVISY